METGSRREKKGERVKKKSWKNWKKKKRKTEALLNREKFEKETRRKGGIMIIRTPIKSDFKKAYFVVQSLLQLHKWNEWTWEARAPWGKMGVGAPRHNSKGEGPRGCRRKSDQEGWSQRAGS